MDWSQSESKKRRPLYWCTYTYGKERGFGDNELPQTKQKYIFCGGESCRHFERFPKNVSDCNNYNLLTLSKKVDIKYTTIKI